MTTIDPEGVGLPAAQVRVLPAGSPLRAVVLVLHGGAVSNSHAATWRQASVQRMTPFAWLLHRRLRSTGVAVWQLRFAVRGWNGEEASPVADARWALHEVRKRHGKVPVVVLGHSMGGRVAARVADDPSVVGIIGLAPWLPKGETVEPVRGRRVTIAHGAHDRVVPAGLSRAWAQRAQGVASEVHRIELRRTGHPMLRRARLWHRWTGDEVERLLDPTRPVP